MSRELFQRSLEEKRVSWLENRDVGGRRWKTRSLLALKVMLGLGLAAGTAWIVPRFGGNVRGLIYRQDSLTAKKLILEGNRLVSREEVLSALAIGAGDNLVEMDLRELARRLERLPAIKSALLAKEYPSALHVKIVERRPLLVLEGQPRWLVDEEGTVMGQVEVPPESLPLVTGLTLSGRRLARPEAAGVVAELREGSLAAGLGWPGVFNILDLTEPSEPLGWLPGPVPVRLGLGGYRDKMSHMAYVLPQLTGGRLAVTYIDLRFESRVVVGTAAAGDEPQKEQVKPVG